MHPIRNIFLIGTALTLLGATLAFGYNKEDPTDPAVEKPAIEYAQQEIPSMAGHFSGFGNLDEPTEIYINEAKYILTNASYASPVLEERITEDTQDNKINQSEVTRIKDLDEAQDGSNREEISQGTNILDPYNKLPPVAESIAIIKNSLYPKLATNEDLSQGFNLQNYSSAIKHLGYTPYIIDNPELYEIFGNKIRQEDLVLYEKLNQNPLDEGIWLEIRIPNWDYHYNLWKGGKSLLPLDNASMQELFPNREDREMIYRGMWMPVQMAQLNMRTGEWTALRISTIDTLKDNFEMLHYIGQRIEEIWNDPGCKEYQRALLFSHSEYYEGYTQWPHLTEQFSFYENKLKSNEITKKLIFLEGLASSLMGGPETPNDILTAYITSACEPDGFIKLDQELPTGEIVTIWKRN
jgi:hypothetical protein